MSVRLHKRIRGGKPTLYVVVTAKRPDGSVVTRERKSPTANRREAEAWGREMERHLVAGTFGQSVSLEAFWPDYLLYLTNNKKPAHRKAVEVAGRIHILPKLGSKLLPDIRKEQVEALKASMLKDKYAPHTINNVLGYLHRGLTLAVEYGKLEKAPGVGLIDYDEEEAEWLEPEEQVRFLGAIGDPARLPMLTCLLETGLRIGECLGLRWGDVDLARAVLKVRRTRVAVSAGYGRPKEGDAREVHLSKRALDTLRAHRHLRNELVFTTPEGKPLTHSMVKRWVGAASKRAGITKDITNHSLRHTRTANLVMAGVPEAIIMAELGWKTTSVLRKYSHLAKSHTASVLAEAERWMANAARERVND